MSIRADEYQTLIEDLWTTLLGLDHEPAADFTPDPEQAHVCAQVQILGTSTWTVRVACPEVLGKKIAAAMFRNRSDGSAGDVQDALGELANIVAGNAKTALSAGPAELTLPAATRVPNHPTADGLHAHVSCGGHVAQFSITQDQASPHAEPYANTKS